jgi:CMP-N-acetylneuraminic acid synthetase
MPSERRTVVALVPMRHHSERVPGKNYRELVGKPLYAHILETLMACPDIANIVVDTDSPIITEGIRKTFPVVQLIDRPETLRGDDVSMNAVLLHDLDVVDGEFFLQTHSTNPLLESDTITKAIRTFFAGYPEVDSLFSVTPVHFRLWGQDGRPINHEPSELLRTQDLPPVFQENSCIYVFDRRGFREHRNRLGVSPRMFEVPLPEALDIDDELSFKIAEWIIKDRQWQLRGGAGSHDASRR